ncbi:molybdopterin-dependent oxidoreductase [Gemmatimonas sp.]|uniref:molybdopterin-dependent oxidoreductase n=1 Tax=Gemmatimonas sp. TaxID=1962908 RepID=UPI00286E4DC5|nr:molybdopterin-dependent oxidoreductase [Gemmatimonas sp.]
MNHPLPPGQREMSSFPRFGLSRFASRFPEDLTRAALHVSGEVTHEVHLANALTGLPRVEHESDFHCVTTWSRRAVRWGGVRFSDFYEAVVIPRACPRPSATLVALRGHDGARTALLLADLLAADVLLVDQLDGQPLGIDHGAPLRLIAPQHYGYKSVKHLARIEFRNPDAGYPVSGFRFMDHPRARVALEERGRGVPGWLLRIAYRPLIPGTVERFARAMAGHRTRASSVGDGVPIRGAHERG